MIIIIKFIRRGGIKRTFPSQWLRNEPSLKLHISIMHFARQFTSLRLYEACLQQYSTVYSYKTAIEARHIGKLATLIEH